MGFLMLPPTTPYGEYIAYISKLTEQKNSPSRGLGATNANWEKMRTIIIEIHLQDKRKQ